MSSLVQGLVLPSVIAVLVAYAIVIRGKKSQSPYPPGPPPKLVIGNAFDIPFKKPWLKYLEWSKKFNSDIIHLSVMNTHIIVLHKLEDCIELLEKRSAIYSSRPMVPVLKLLKSDDLVPMLPYGNALRRQKKYLQDGLKKESVSSYHDVILQKVHILLGQLLHNPTEFRRDCKSFGIAVTMAVTFGYDVEPGQKKDRLIELSEFVSTESSELLLLGRSLINIFPFLVHIPPWFPGAVTQRRAAMIGKATIEHKNVPFEYVKKNMAAGVSKDCILVRLLEARTNSDGSYNDGDDEDVMKNAVASIYLAGIDALWCAHNTFIFAMAYHPEEQKKAQEEIDRVIGSDRLPTFEDRPSLPYVEALLREVRRWRPFTPIIFPHTAMEEDVYRGYRFPKGAVVMTNTWAITRDEEMYPDPESFKPERFLNADGALNDDHVDYIFGFGRRVCSGQFLSDSMIWMMAVSVLSIFNISKARDENGAQIDLDKDAFLDALLSQPLPFKCSIVPRSPKAEEIIQNASDSALSNLKHDSSM